ncbi:hypothetical protein ACMATS_00315 [Streptoverticillium reticulum]|uniref:hypothetical protein n=1 Tax=Streptoverticillium reticulum TaxID=1433415 RepID=UPI0039BF6772
MGQALAVECHEFEVEGAWVSRFFTGPMVLVAGESGAGKSTGLESQWYAVGLNCTKVMPAVRACERVRLTFQIGTVRWRATRSARSSAGTVEFENLSEPGQPPVRCPVKPGRSGELSAAEFFQDLLGVPRIGTGPGRLTMEDILPWMYIQQTTIAVSYLGGLSPARRRLAGRTLLGAHDAQVEALRSRAERARKEWSAAKGTLEKVLAVRAERGLDELGDLQARQTQWTTEHEETAARARAASAELSKLARQHQSLADQAKATEPAQQAARASADEAEKEARSWARAEGEAEGLYTALRERAADPAACPVCHQKLVTEGLSDEQCRLCKEIDPGRAQRSRQDEERVRQARGQRDRARAARERADAAAAAARLRALQADQAVREAYTRAAEFGRDAVEPQRETVRGLEAAARELAARLEQLAEHLREVDVLRDLERDRDRLEAAKNTAQEEFKSAEEDVSEHVKALVTRWSLFFEERMKATDAQVRSASIDAEDFSPLVNGRPFEAQAVAGAVLVRVNINAMLALRDLMREVPAIRLPGFLMIDSPLSGLGTQGHDRQACETMLRALVDCAIRPDTQGHVQQVICAVNDPLDQPLPAVRQILVDKTGRYIPGLPADQA